MTLEPSVVTVAPGCSSALKLKFTSLFQRANFACGLKSGCLASPISTSILSAGLLLTTLDNVLLPCTKSGILGFNGRSAILGNYTMNLSPQSFIFLYIPSSFPSCQLGQGLNLSTSQESGFTWCSHVLSKNSLRERSLAAST